MKQQEFYTAKELSEKLRVNIMTIYRYIDAKSATASQLSLPPIWGQGYS